MQSWEHVSAMLMSANKTSHKQNCNHHQACKLLKREIAEEQAVQRAAGQRYCGFAFVLLQSETQNHNVSLHLARARAQFAGMHTIHASEARTIHSLAVISNSRMKMPKLSASRSVKLNMILPPHGFMICRCTHPSECRLQCAWFYTGMHPPIGLLLKQQQRQELQHIIMTSLARAFKLAEAQCDR